MELRIPSVFLFDPAGNSRRKTVTRGRAEKPSTVPDRRLFCVACGHAITHWDHAVAIDGAREHRLTNPAGFSFHIGCFRAADGCTEMGDATTEHTWFAGCAWRIAVCARCRAHVGWRFEGREGFYGLILSRLRSAASSGT
jgi:hypothetical protein